MYQKFLDQITCVYTKFIIGNISIGLTFIDGESSSFMVELFSSTTIIAYSTSSPLWSGEHQK